MLGHLPKDARFFTTRMPDGTVGLACARCFEREVSQARAKDATLGPALPISPLMERLEQMFREEEH